MMKPVTKTTRGELATLSEQLPAGELFDWCNLSSAGPSRQVVFADSVMLSRCRQAASSFYTVEEESNNQEESNEQFYGQPGDEVDSGSDFV